ncbi:MAG: NACHT domain-containing protein [Desulfomonilaceae bacterium]
MDILFDKIRPLGNSRGKGFEELCCQIAEMERHREAALAGARFYRKAGEGGDAGIEGYYQLPNGDEWGWQAKYLFKLGKKQWEQIDKSVLAALENHPPRLVRYTVCLPIDLSDAPKKKELSQRDHWNNHVAKWNKWTATYGRHIQFEHWGAFELRIRLMAGAHERAGYICWWFDETLLTRDWFERRLLETIKDAGPRYTPELHVDLPIAKSFDAFGRTDSFTSQIESLWDELVRKWKRAKSWHVLQHRLPYLAESVDAVGQHVEKLARSVKECANNAFDFIDFEKTREIAKELLDAVSRCLKQVKESESSHQDSSGSSATGAYVPSTRELTSALEYGLDTLTRSAGEIIEFSHAKDARTANHRVLLVSGQAGAGKTHLFCDVAKKRLEKGLPTVLLLGEKFAAARNPWTQITEHLHLKKMEPERFLGALDAASQVAGRRAIIMIDALNEGEGIDLWKKHLSGMVRLLEKFPRVALAVSCRDTYKQAIIPKRMVDENEIAELVHLGFEGMEYDATKTFFAHFHIQRPSAPLLVPEFSVPLFLKLLCEGLRNQGLRKIPKGLKGITKIFTFFVDSVDHKLAGKLGYDQDEGLVRKAVERLAGTMAEKGTTWLKKPEAKRIVGAVRPEAIGCHYEATLFRNLVHEGLLTEDLDWTSARASDSKPDQIVRFAYDRLANHLVVSTWMKDVSDAEGLAAVCRASACLNEVVTAQSFARRHAGLLYALSVQVPEKIGLELVDVFPEIRLWEVSGTAFLSSLILRDPTTTTDGTRDFLNELWKYDRFTHSIYDVVLMVSCEPDHCLNAIDLHRHLSKFCMADRDAIWSIYLHQNYGYGEGYGDDDGDNDGGSIDRLIEWAWGADTSEADDVVVELCATALIWFLTSSNRFLRDRATKALVSLLRSRIPVLLRLMDRFQNVDDPYVQERLYAVAYGVSMLSGDDAGLSDLAAKVYQWVFEHGEPPAHILLRDYARGVIEVSHVRKARSPSVNMAKVTPPYKSAWPLPIPAEADLEKYGEHPERRADPAWPMVWLYHSIMGDSDWVIYVLRPACNKFSYIPPSELLVPDLEDSKAQNEKVTWDRFDARFAQRWIMKRVIQLGWTPERFGKFDEQIGRFYYRGRGVTDKPERMRKKYAWIGMHEFLAHLADNVRYRGDSWGLEPQRYCGPWQFFRRDIDPSVLVRKTFGTDASESVAAWWQPVGYTLNENDEERHEAWIKDSKDIVDPVQLIDVADQDGMEWLTLEGHYDWTESTPTGEEKYENPRRNIWFQIRSYLVKADEADSLINRLNRKDLWGGWMPEHDDFYEVFIGEFPWAPAFRQYDAENPWIEANPSLPWPVMMTSTWYHWERGYDCSLDSHAIQSILPSAWLLRALKVNWSRTGFSFVDSEGRVAIFDPSATEAGPHVLLASKPRMAAFLSDNKLGLVWTALGERRYLGGDTSGHSARMKIQAVYILRGSNVCGKPVRTTYEPGHK